MTAIQGIGEIALRTEDLEGMSEFYGEVLGFDRYGDPPFDSIVFFRVGETGAGHPQVVALFDRSGSDGYVAPDVGRTTVDHVAFTVDRATFDAEAERLESLGYELAYAYHDWVEWRSLYLSDPDGNRVELVCHDPQED